MTYRDARVKVLEDKRRRCRSLIPEIKSLSWERVQQCNLCGESEIATISNCDRYGIPLGAGMCLRCGLVFLLDRLTLEGYAEFYRQYYRPLVSQFHGRAINAESIQREQSQYATRLVETLRPWLNKIPTVPTLLDIGGSTGVVALYFADTFCYKPTILDPSPDELKVAKARGLKAVEGFLETYEAAEQFDLVLMCQTIDHLFDLRKSLMRVRDVVRPEGFFFCDIVDFEEVCFLNGCVEGALHLDHCYYFSQETALRMFSSLGWHVIHIDTATRPAHAGYLMKPGVTDSRVGAPDCLASLRRFQHMQAQWQLASQHTYGMVHWARTRAYRAKQQLNKLFSN